MGHDVSSSGGEEAIAQAAAQWVVRLGGDPLTPDERAGLDMWIAADPRHRAAFDKARLVWGWTGELGDDAAAALLPERADAVVPAKVVAMSQARHRWFAPAALAALAASVLFAVTLGPQWLHMPAEHPVAALPMVQTAAAEQRLVTLPDGSTALLGPASALATDYGTGERRVRLERGVAIFTAAPRQGAEKRPFVVAAGGGVIRALGTRFQVEFASDGVEVAVLEHAVEVARTATPDVTTRLQAGETVRYGEAGVGTIRRTDVAIVTAWQQGQLVFNEQPLGEVVVWLNRYRGDRLVLAAGLDERRVSGVFDAAKPDAALQLLQDQFGLRQRKIAADTIQLY